MLFQVNLLVLFAVIVIFDMLVLKRTWSLKVCEELPYATR